MLKGLLAAHGVRGVHNEDEIKKIAAGLIITNILLTYAIEVHRNITAKPPDLGLLDIEMPWMTELGSKKDYDVEGFALNAGGG